MRPRKILLPLTLESLGSLMIPGKPYTAALLSCIFDGSPAAITALLDTLVASGAVTSSHADCGRKRDLREERRIYWRSLNGRTNIAERRQGPAEIPGELHGYTESLQRLQRLCTASRR